MDNKIIDKFIKFIEKDVTPTIKKDFKWLGKVITDRCCYSLRVLDGQKLVNLG